MSRLWHDARYWFDLPEDPSDELIDAICQARCQQPGIHWADGMTEGVARIERFIAERIYAAVRNGS